MQIREFVPPGVEPEELVITSNHLASTFATDFGDRSMRLAEAISVVSPSIVVAYERPEVDKANRTTRGYKDAAARTGEELQEYLDKAASEDCLVPLRVTQRRLQRASWLCSAIP